MGFEYDDSASLQKYLFNLYFEIMMENTTLGSDLWNCTLMWERGGC